MARRGVFGMVGRQKPDHKPSSEKFKRVFDALCSPPHLATNYADLNSGLETRRHWTHKGVVVGKQNQNTNVCTHNACDVEQDTHPRL